MNFFAGVDIGSTSIKIALCNKSGDLVGTAIAPSGSFFQKNASDALRNVCLEKGVREQDIGCTVSTGYGRKLFKSADKSISEITANAVGARYFIPGAQVRTIINIGGQDLKIIGLDDDGNIRDFTMNDKCAAGTGRFLEMAARNLEMEVDELTACHEGYQGIPAIINSTCTVFAESEIIGLLAKGCEKGEIVAGIHYSIARRVARLTKRIGVRDTVLFDGGPALNHSLKYALEDELMVNLVVPEQPQTTTAFGAAIIARDTFANLVGKVHAT